MNNANLKNANLSGSEHAFLAGACLAGADLSDTCFIAGHFNDAVCINTNFS
ncbi:MAG: hypothetical protein F6K24_54295 [Okeania sp. SIO2D1]|uniref:pentapeptide repeat-containing protein n=1 Tax=Okeania sp. SIO2C9 TaxID=2607791 RepID=UPI0013B7BEED|nr:pentapeptide repeat-containing protein [Okeania sp. SIO2C9]NEQ76243.1 hypothetical protein [Okeania sp. SIO2C9]NES73542.1 hypothetical protein [Okeania sp. SIO2D1]